MTPARLDGVAAVLVALPFLLGAAAAPAGDGQVVFSFTDRAIDESSGLAVVDGLFVTVNDSGDSGRVFTIDPVTGDTVGSTRWDGEATDDEALAPAPDGTVWVGDIGDNLARRTSIEVRDVPVGRGPRDVDPMAYELVFPDGAQDAETLLCDPVTGALYVASKGVLGGTLYAAHDPLRPGRNVLSEVGSVLGVATDGAFFPDGRHAILRDYGRAVVYSMPDLTPVGSFALPAQEQGEGIAVAPDGTVYVSSEGVGSDVLRVPLPADVQAALAAPPSTTPTPSSTTTPTPSDTTRSREDSELPESTETSRPAWPWFLGGWLALLALVVLLRSLRQR